MLNLLRFGWLPANARFSLAVNPNRAKNIRAGRCLGPVLGSQLPKAVNLTLGNLQELVAEGDARNAGRELSRFIEANMPGGPYGMRA